LETDGNWKHNKLGSRGHISRSTLLAGNINDCTQSEGMVTCNFKSKNGQRLTKLLHPQTLYNQLSICLLFQCSPKRLILDQRCCIEFDRYRSRLFFNGVGLSTISSTCPFPLFLFSPLAFLLGLLVVISTLYLSPLPRILSNAANGRQSLSLNSRFGAFWRQICIFTVHLQSFVTYLLTESNTHQQIQSSAISLQ